MKTYPVLIHLYPTKEISEHHRDEYLKSNSKLLEIFLLHFIFNTKQNLLSFFKYIYVIQNFEWNFFSVSMWEVRQNGLMQLREV